MKERLKKLLRWSQRYARTDMVYVARGGFWTTFGFALSGAVSLLLAVAYANLLPKETYGTYKYTLAVAGMFGFLSLTGMNNAVTRAVARGQDGALPYSVKVQLRWNALFLAALGAVGAYYLLNGNRALGLSMFALGVCSPLTWAYATYSAYLSGKKEFRLAAIWSIVSTAVYSAGMIAAMALTQDVVRLVAAYAVLNLLLAAGFYAATLARFRPAGLDPQEAESMVSFGKHLSFVNVLSSAAQYADSVIIFHLLGPVELAAYTFANLIPERIKKFVKNLISIVMPQLATKDFRAVIVSLPLRLLQSMALGALLAGGYALIADPVFRLVFPQYHASVWLSRLIALNLVLLVPASYLAVAVQSQNLLRPMYYGSVSTNSLRLVLMIVGGVTHGVIGVVVAKLAANVFNAFFGVFIVYREFRLKERERTDALTHEPKP